MRSTRPNERLLEEDDSLIDPGRRRISALDRLYFEKPQHIRDMDIAVFTLKVSRLRALTLRSWLLVTLGTVALRESRTAKRPNLERQQRAKTAAKAEELSGKFRQRQDAAIGHRVATHRSMAER
ncbi:hypothetical protein U6G28_07245 [Actinomycetaceae bacterium MB13-C1-2]|nr:hypothetical protein U6G28_07245 [Actinomycetaceae bacterium MB13-C1-2]